MKKQHKLLVLSRMYEEHEQLLLMRDHCAHVLLYLDHVFEIIVDNELQVLQQ